MNMIQEAWDTNNVGIPLVKPLDGYESELTSCTQRTGLPTVLAPSLEQAVYENVNTELDDRFVDYDVIEGGIPSLMAQEISRFEKEYAGCGYICGIDEVGRGPLAGPVVAGAVILPKDCKIKYINDSKKLSAKMREELYDEIMDKAVAVGIGYASEKRIDEINILNATYEAMREALDKLSVTPDILLNDAVTIPKVSIRQVPIIKGDAKSISIGAASIVAKVTRDRLMEELALQYPQYDFASNKGYGSAKHIEALKTYGPCKIHRKTFIKHFCDTE